MRCLVTGGAGFIGSHLVRRLVSEGHEIRVADDLSTGRLDNLAGIDADIRTIDLVSADLAGVVAGVDAIFHLAAVGSVPRSVREPWRAHEAAASLTLRLLIAAREAGVERFISSSSSSVYGNVAAPPMRETMATAPRSPYAVAKLAAEGYVRIYAQLHGMRTISLRYFNVFGERQDPGSAYAAVIPLFVSAYARHERPRVFGDGKQSRDFTYVANVVEANLLALRADGLAGQSVNVAAGQPHTVLELLAEIAREFGYTMEPEFAAERPGDIRDSHADTTLARELLGFRPGVDFRNGLRPTIAWLREREGSAR